MNDDKRIQICKTGLEFAKRYNCHKLINFYQKKITSLQIKPYTGIRSKPLIYLIIDHKGWCGERLSLNLIDQLPEFDCRIIRLGDKEHLLFDGDLYIYRNLSWLNAVPVPKHILYRIVALVESERVFSHPSVHWTSKILGIIPLNKKLYKLIQPYKPKHLMKPLENGIDVDNFIPVTLPKEEFVVGTAGNFSLDYYDDWKGFSKYIVPACKKANVRLEWCGWRGISYSGLKSKQYPLNEMYKFYQQLSCFVLMSKSEGCSGVTFEAMASGLPIISTKVGWHGENVKKGIIWIKRPQNETPYNIQKTIDELAQKITWLKNHPDYCIKMGKLNRQFAEQHSWKNVGQQWKQYLIYFLNIIKLNKY